MAEIVNLRRQRKRKQRADGKRKAAENRVLHGRPAGQGALETMNRTLLERRLEEHRRDSASVTHSDDSPE